MAELALFLIRPAVEWVREKLPPVVESRRAIPEVMRVGEMALCPRPTSNSPQEIRSYTLPRRYNRADPAVMVQFRQACSIHVRELLVTLPLYATGWQG